MTESTNLPASVPILSAFPPVTTEEEFLFLLKANFSFSNFFFSTANSALHPALSPLGFCKILSLSCSLNFSFLLGQSHQYAQTVNSFLSLKNIHFFWPHLLSSNHFSCPYSKAKALKRFGLTFFLSSFSPTNHASVHFNLTSVYHTSEIPHQGHLQTLCC